MAILSHLRGNCRIHLPQQVNFRIEPRPVALEGPREGGNNNKDVGVIAPPFGGNQGRWCGQQIILQLCALGWEGCHCGGGIQPTLREVLRCTSDPEGVPVGAG